MSWIIWVLLWNITDIFFKKNSSHFFSFCSMNHIWYTFKGFSSGHTLNINIYALFMRWQIFIGDIFVQSPSLLMIERPMTPNTLVQKIRTFNVKDWCPHASTSMACFVTALQIIKIFSGLIIVRWGCCMCHFICSCLLKVWLDYVFRTVILVFPIKSQSYSYIFKFFLAVPRIIFVDLSN